MLFKNPENVVFSDSNIYLDNFTRSNLEAVDFITVAVTKIYELLLSSQFILCQN